MKLDGLRWQDMQIKFHDDRSRNSSLLPVQCERPQYLCVSDGRDSSSTQLRRAQVS
jgi:hypothetical protein